MELSSEPDEPKKSTKAIVGSVIAGLGCLSTALIDDSISLGEWITFFSTLLVTFQGIYWTSNK